MEMEPINVECKQCGWVYGGIDHPYADRYCYRCHNSYENFTKDIDPAKLKRLFGSTMTFMYHPVEIKKQIKYYCEQLFRHPLVLLL